MLNKEKFATRMLAIFELFGEKATESKLDLYYLVLQDMTNEEFDKSIKAILENWKYSYTPKPAHIKQVLLDTNKLNVEVTAQSSWKLVIGTIEKVGSYRAVKFEDPYCNKIVDILGGWKHIATKTYKELEWIKKEFISLYINLANRKEEIEESKELLGISETDEVKYIKADYQIPEVEVTNSKKILTKNEAFNKKLLEINKKVRI